MKPDREYANDEAHHRPATGGRPGRPRTRRSGKDNAAGDGNPHPRLPGDRRASLDEESEIRPALRALVLKEFDRGRTIPIVPFPADGAAVQDTPRLTLVVLDPESEWTPAFDAAAGKGSGSLRGQISEWMRQRGKVELWLSWKRVNKEIAEGTLGGDFDRADRAEIVTKLTDAEEAAKDEVWGGYRFAVLADHQEPDGLKTIDLGAGHSSGSETLCGRVITALKSQALLNESVGAGYIERNWPPALKDTGAWPLASLRQSFLNGSLTRLLDPDAVLRVKIVEFVSKGDFGLASGHLSASAVPGTAQAGAARQTGEPGGGYERVWFNEPITPDEVGFEPGVFLILKAKARRIKAAPEPVSPVSPEP